MQQDTFLEIALIIAAAFGITKFRINSTDDNIGNVWKHSIKKIALIIFYAVYLGITKYLAKSITFYLRDDFRDDPNHFIWAYCLIGALIWFPRYIKNGEKRNSENIPNFIISEVMKHIAFLVITILAFCTPELERLHISTLGTGVMVLVIYAAARIIAYRCREKEYALNLQNIFWLYFIACLFWYLGTRIFNPSSRDMLPYVPISIFVTFVPMLVILFITADWNLTVHISTIINFVWTLTHYYVYQFRGSVLIPGDILAAGTAFSVAGDYKYSMNTDIWWLCMISVILMLFAGSIYKIRVPNRRLTFRIAGTTISCIAILLWYNSDFITNLNLPYRTGWFQVDMYNSVGYTLGFIEIMKSNKVTKPDNYSEKYVDELASEYSDDSSDVSEIKPDIIAIMNEAYADLSDVNDLDTNIDCMEYYHSLSTSGNTAVGRTLVSTTGGGTGKSEYEFLTGNSQEFLPDESPYTTEIYDDIYTIVSTLKSQGYYAMATHPNDGSNWKRNSVYKCMQFDELKFIEDYENPELMRGHVTDAEVYRSVLSWMESRDSDEPQFVFAITMQNHSPFGVVQLREGEELPVIRNSVDEPDELDEYLSLIYESDRALKELIEAVDKRERPTVVVMFGDHFPTLESRFWDAIGDKGTETGLAKAQIKYATPYIVHANYDVDMSGIPSYLSVNYLSAFVLKSCGLKITAYDNYRIEMQERIPAINFMGLMTEDGQWYSFGEGLPEKYADKVNEYNILQYNLRFGNPSKQMFGINEE